MRRAAWNSSGDFARDKRSLAWAAGEGSILGRRLATAGGRGIGKVYQRCRPALVVRVNLCVTDNTNAAIIGPARREMRLGARRYAEYNWHNRYIFTRAGGHLCASTGP